MLIHLSLKLSIVMTVNAFVYRIIYHDTPSLLPILRIPLPLSILYPLSPLKAMIRLANWEVIECALGYISTFPALPLSPHVVFISEQWLSGNLTSLCPHINILGTTNTKTNSNNINSSSSGSLELNQEGTKDNKKHSDRSVVTMSDKVLESYLVLINTFYCNFYSTRIDRRQEGNSMEQTGKIAF
jgi:hypothetical protein